MGAANEAESDGMAENGQTEGAEELNADLIDGY